ncbi:LuxR family transcriptional regulator [Enterobacteriaceae bacterium 89]|nr:LuxR family transcriptional regulator [Enterobacteriaceae bacterium 89]
MNSESCVRSGHADLWLSDLYLRCGLENILQNIHFHHSAIRYVFLTERHYSDVVKQNYDLTTTKFILLTEGSVFNFLGDEAFYQLPMKTSVKELQKLINTLSLHKEVPNHHQARISLTDRERQVIDLIREGKRIAEMGPLLNVHIKTVYQIRQALMKKMGCDGLIDFLRTLRSDVFRNWLTETHRYH